MKTTIAVVMDDPSGTMTAATDASAMSVVGLPARMMIIGATGAVMMMTTAIGAATKKTMAGAVSTGAVGRAIPKVTLKQRDGVGKSGGRTDREAGRTTTMCEAVARVIATRITDVRAEAADGRVTPRAMRRRPGAAGRSVAVRDRAAAMTMTTTNVVVRDRTKAKVVAGTEIPAAMPRRRAAVGTSANRPIHAGVPTTTTTDGKAPVDGMRRDMAVGTVIRAAMRKRPGVGGATAIGEPFATEEGAGDGASSFCSFQQQSMGRSVVRNGLWRLLHAPRQSRALAPVKPKKPFGR